MISLLHFVANVFFDACPLVVVCVVVSSSLSASHRPTLGQAQGRTQKRHPPARGCPPLLVLLVACLVGWMNDIRKVIVTPDKPIE